MRDHLNIARILVAVDFSANSILGLDHAVQIARRHQAVIHLFHALPGKAWLRLQDRVIEGFEVLEGRCANAGVTASSGFTVGPLDETLVDAVKTDPVDLIVIGARGHHGLKRFMLGSDAEKVIRVAPAPVLIVHPEHDESIGAPRRILAATDFSECSLEATRTGIAVASGGADDASEHETLNVQLLHAWAAPVFTGMDFECYVPAMPVDESADAAEQRLAEMAGVLDAPGVSVEPIVAHDYPAHAILDHAERGKADLITIGTHGRDGMSRLVNGSVAERVIRHAPCPVLAVRQR